MTAWPSTRAMISPRAARMPIFKPAGTMRLGLSRILIEEALGSELIICRVRSSDIPSTTRISILSLGYVWLSTAVTASAIYCSSFRIGIKTVTSGSEVGWVFMRVLQLAQRSNARIRYDNAQTSSTPTTPADDLQFRLHVLSPVEPGMPC